MTFAERGIFLEMLIEQWMRGDLPDSPRAVADAIATSDAQAVEIEQSWPALRRQFMTVPEASNRIQNPPLEEIRRDRRRWLKKQQTSGARGGSTTASNRRHEREIKPAPSLQALGSEPAPYNTTQQELSRSDLKREETSDPRAHAPTVLDGSLPRDHRNHVYCDPTFSICVPSAVHSKLLNAVSRKFDGDRTRAHQALLGWYAEIAGTLPAETVMGDAFHFWQPRFDAAFASPAPTAVLGKQATRLASALANIKREAVN